MLKNNIDLAMTENDKRLLKLIFKHNPLQTSASGLGFMLYPEPKRKSMTDKRWPQGMALAGGKASARLEELRLITIKSAGFGVRENVYRLTKLGIDKLKEIDHQKDL